MIASNRRTMLVAGLGGATAVTLVAGRVEAAHYPADAGQPVPEAKGNVRRVTLSERPSTIPAYAKVMMLDIVFSPGSSEPVEEMMADMIEPAQLSWVASSERQRWPLMRAGRTQGSIKSFSSVVEVPLSGK